MILRIRHPGCEPADVNLGEGRAGRTSHRGELVRGGPGSYELAQIAARIRTQRDADLRRESRT